MLMCCLKHNGHCRPSSLAFRLFPAELIFKEAASLAGLTIGTGAGGAPADLHFREDLLVKLPHAFDSQLAHVLVAAYLRLRELAVLSEYDVEAHS